MRRNSKLKFSEDMYNNTVGSFVISSYILGKEKPSLHFLKKQWIKYKKMIQRSDLDFIHEKTFVEDVRKFFKLSDENLNIAVVTSTWNVLFLPYILDKDGKVLVLPIREDGIYPTTATHADNIQVIDWSKKDEDTEQN